jgi:hypothetical protein
MLKYRKKVVQAGRISLEQYNKEIDQAESEIESGDFYSQKEALKIASQWGRQ